MHHKHIQRTGQERDTSKHLHVRVSRWCCSLIHAERLAGVPAQGPRTVFSSVVIIELLETNYTNVALAERKCHCNLSTSR